MTHTLTVPRSLEHIVETECSPRVVAMSSYLRYFVSFCRVIIIILQSHFRGCQGCQVFATKPAQLLLKTSPIAF